jgi:holo-[acyl-carrier protein] synthase
MLLVGIDLVDVEEVERSIARLGDRYKKRLFSERELASCQDAGSTSALLAGHLAAKEAAIKVLRPGGRGLDWRSIEVRRELTGKLTVQLSGAASQLAREAGITRIEVSLSCSAGQAMAVALASHGQCPPAGRSVPEGER